MLDADAGPSRSSSFHTAAAPAGGGGGEGDMSEGAVAEALQAMAIDLNLPVIPRGRMTEVEYDALIQRLRLERGEIAEESGSCDGDAPGARAVGGPADPSAPAVPAPSSSGGRSWSQVAAAPPPSTRRVQSRYAPYPSPRPAQQGLARTPGMGGPQRRALPQREARGRGPPRPEEQYAAGGPEARMQRLGRGTAPPAQ